MTDLPAEPVAVEVVGWKVTTAAEPPTILSAYRAHAQLHEDFDKAEGADDAGFLFVAIGRAPQEWPSLVITQHYWPSVGGFSPGVLIVPETEIAFIGAGTRLLCYQLDSGYWHRHWDDEAHLGFWGWRRHGDVILMSAELELAAWSLSGLKLWTTFVEPPWSYEVTDQTVRLDVMGSVTSFPIEAGPAAR